MKFLGFLILIFLTLAGIISANFVFAGEKIDINTAPLEDLVKIIHIGEARALELISLRPFSSLDDLDRIKGIGEKRIEDIKKQGLAWVAPTTEKPADVGFPPAPAREEITENRSLLAVATTTEIATVPQKELAEISHPLQENRNSAIVIFTAVFTAFLSGVIILILKHVRT